MTFMHVTRANQDTTAAYSSWTEVQVHVLPAIKAGLAIPWNTLRLLRRYVTTYSKGSILTHWCFRWLKSSGICLAGEERMHHISSQFVGDNPKGEIAPFSGGQVNSCQILGLTFAPIHKHMQNLMRIVQEHLLSIEPQLVAAIPPPAKRVKNKY